ncbi:hypothetical protein CL633_01025 [bacterium]|nr:hypothetical protein [bacterium]|tara:strand:+ start:3027 stop:3575 length:549 start_codon:yes stop_codon:yes gene_type:complete
MQKQHVIISAVAILILGYFIITGSGKLDSPEKSNQASVNQAVSNIEQSKKIIQAKFSGEQGEKVILENSQIKLDAKIFDDNLAHFYNVELNGKNIYFFVVKDKQGIYRAAANACQVCYGARIGFRQEGDFMTCNTCGNKYPMAKIATEKGGCNPGPINPNLEVINDQVIINKPDIEQVANFF